MNKLLLFITIVFSLSGCGIAMRALEFASPTFEELMEEQRQDNTEQDVVGEFQSLLDDGWELFLYRGEKIILIKDTEEGFQIKDIFGVLDN
jgi:hypothetical protein